MACVREYLLWVREVSYGTPDLTTGAPTTGGFHWIRLDQGNRFTVRAARGTTQIPYGGGWNVPYYRVGKTVSVGGQLSTIIHYSQASNLLKWAMTQINAGRTTPWTTTDASGVMPTCDLASASLYHGIMRSDGTWIRTAYRGMKVAGLRLDCSAGSPLLNATFELVGSKPIPNDDLGGVDSSEVSATEFPGPTDHVWPTDPVLFQESSGLVKIGTTRTQYDSVSLDIRNSMDAQRFESRYLVLARLLGRGVMLSANLHYKATPDNRAAMEALTAQDTEVSWSNGVNTIKVDMHGAALFDSVSDDLPLEGLYRQSVTVGSFHDASVGTDLTFTYS
jgi:hypothetical protein